MLRTERWGVFSRATFRMKPIASPARFDIRAIASAATHPLRLSVLRPNRPASAAIFPDDDAPSTRHLGAFRDGQVVGIASLFVADLTPEHAGAPAYQLRGMATAPEVRGAGFGKALVIECVAFGQARGAKILWCNARTSAMDFYRKLGFEIIGPEFDIPDVGPHFRMWIRLDNVK
jgi:GNAT superfamily N-acetyltransferase